jgi:Bifunctional DNA primase/polymerase, N-terminal
MTFTQTAPTGSSSDSTITSANHNPTLEVALGYHSRDYAVTPVTYREKEPYLPGWPKRRLTEPQIRQHFVDHPGNIGIVLGSLSGGLADIDNDCPEAVALAAHLLPPTGCIFGRASNPSSHFIYKVANPGPRRPFTGVGDQGMRVEYRAEGCMTLFPGSVHPSGEPVEFVVDGEPGEVTSEVLLKAVNKVAAGSLIVPRWISGQRHETALALGGTLARSDWPLDEAREFVEAICTVAGDTELPDRLKAVEDAYEAVGAGKLAYGLPKLAELIGEETVTRIKPWLGLKGGDVALATPNAISVIPSESSSLEDAPLSDTTNAAWFAHRTKNRCRYSHHHRRWFLWNGAFWQEDKSEQALCLAQEAIWRLGDVAPTLSPRRQQELAGWIKQSLNQGKLQAMLRLAQPLCAIDAEKFGGSAPPFARIFYNEVSIDQLRCKCDLPDLSEVYGPGY